MGIDRATKARMISGLVPALALSSGLGGLGLAGCAHTKSDALAESRQTIESLQTQNAAYRRRTEELDNRVFLLTDQLDSYRVNAERVAPPTLPTVVLVPPAETSSKATAEEPWPAQSESTVSYAGEAAESPRRRLLLQAFGDQAPTLTTVVAPKTAPARSQAQKPKPQPPKLEPPKPAPRPSPIGLYQNSLAALRDGRHTEAESGFRQFLEAHAKSDFADNAQYWLGECYYAKHDYARAVGEFRRVVEHFPMGNKVPDALLKVGYSYLALGSAELGRQTLEQLVHSYPRHDLASLATSRLATMKTPIENPSSKPNSQSQEAP
jgi:tol-pal system protein YbgF